MSEPLVIVDTGPLLALLRQDDMHHVWAVNAHEGLPGPFVTSEAVISETCFLLQRQELPLDRLYDLFKRGALRVTFDFQAQWTRLSALMMSYANMPGKRRMSLADATLVRLAELHDNGIVFTVDSDFRIYRKNGRQQIPVIAPWITPDN